VPDRRPGKRPRNSPKKKAPEPPADAVVLQELGARIRAARMAAELTQETAAARAGIDYKRWQRLEQGDVNPTARTLLRVADAVDTTFWDLLSSSRRSGAAARTLPPNRARKRPGAV
jgi:transcriptional regulator with XRE-family HTH domain